MVVDWVVSRDWTVETGDDAGDDAGDEAGNEAGDEVAFDEPPSLPPTYTLSTFGLSTAMVPDTFLLLSAAISS